MVRPHPTSHCTSEFQFSCVPHENNDNQVRIQFPAVSVLVGGTTDISSMAQEKHSTSAKIDIVQTPNQWIFHAYASIELAQRGFRKGCGPRSGANTAIRGCSCGFYPERNIRPAVSVRRVGGQISGTVHVLEERSQILRADYATSLCGLRTKMAQTILVVRDHIKGILASFILLSTQQRVTDFEAPRNQVSDQKFRFQKEL